MTASEQEEKPLSPGLAAAIYFAIFSLCFLIFTKYTLLSLQDSLKLPLFPSILVAMFTGAYVGSLFGAALAGTRTWYHSFIIGCFIALFSLVLISLAIMVHAWFYDGAFYGRLHSWRDYFVIFGALFASITLIAGVWLIPLTGLAAIHFNRHFLPGLLAVDAQRIEENKRQRDNSDD